MSENGKVCSTYACLLPTLGFLVLLYHGLRLWSRARNSNSNSDLNEQVVTTYNAHLCIWCMIELSIGVWFGSNIYFCTQHISFGAISTDPNTNNKWWCIHGQSNEGCSAHTPHICMLDVSMNLERMCGAVVVSNICVHQHTWVCHHQNRTSARRRQIRLERIRHTWSKTMGRKYDCSWIKQSRRIKNGLVRLRPHKSSKFW